VRILIAEDEPIPRRLLARLLENWGYDVVVACDGLEAWEALQGPDAPRLAVLDWVMPGMDGLDLCRKIRADSDGRYVYVILLTSKDRPDELVAGMSAGADDYLTKPANPEELQARLRAGQRIIELQCELRARQEQLAAKRAEEVEIGRRIQESLLLGEAPSGRSGLAVSALTIPSEKISGDFYEFIEQDEDCLDVIVGDVMGHGVPAALLGAATKAHLVRAVSRLLLTSESTCRPSPQEIVAAVHQVTAEQISELAQFVTLCYVRFDTARSELTLVDCGHMPTLHYRRDRDDVVALKGRCVPLGILGGREPCQDTIPLGPEDVLLFYSDGISEARNAEGEFFGEERIRVVLAAEAGREPAEIQEALQTELVAFVGGQKFRDDVTMVVVKMAPRPAQLVSALPEGGAQYADEAQASR